MREIKFRAFYPKSQSWVYFDLNKGFTDEGYQIYKELLQLKLPFYQYTGLKDIKGNEIFEGDIVKYQDVRDGTKTKTKQVYFDVECGIWYCGSEMLSALLVEQNNDEWKAQKNHAVKEKQYIHIIGNIYDNPELMEETKWRL